MVEPSIESFDDPTWASCHVIVSAFEDIAPAVSRAVAAASAVVRREPDLADVLDLRFVDAGPRPAPGSAGAIEVAEALVALSTQPVRPAPETYVALLVVDDRSAAAADLVEASRARFAALGVDGRTWGVAVQDDGAPPGAVAILGPGAEVERRLATEIVRQARMLLESTARRPGLSPQTLAELRPPSPDETLHDRSGADRTVAVGTTLATAADRAAAARRGARGPTIEPPAPGGDAARPVSVEEGRAHAPQTRKARCRVVVATFGRAPSRRQWSTARKLLLALDRELATEGGALEVAVLGPNLDATSAGQPAGQLRRRDLARPDERIEPADLWRALEREVSGEGTSEGSPAIVMIVALSSPLADVAAVDAYARLASLTSPVWLLAGADRDLLSDVYAKHGTVLDIDTSSIHDLVAALVERRDDL